MILLLGAMIFASTGSSAQFGFLKDLLGKGASTPTAQADTMARDSVARKPRKPLESFFFDDSVRMRQFFSWQVRPGYNEIRMIEIDTLLDRFEVDYPFMRPDAGSEYLGNEGGAAQRFNYAERPSRRDFRILDAYDAYLWTPDRAPYYNVKRPFTHLSWWMSGQTQRAEEQFRLTHAQSISPSSGFNVSYLNRGTKGMYENQRTKQKNLSLAFDHTGKKYAIHTGYIFNGGELEENGGIRWDGDLANPELIPNAISVRLTDARNRFRGNTFYITQGYGIPLQRVTDLDLSIADKSSIFIGHAFEFTTVTRRYTDSYQKTLFKLGDPQAEDYPEREEISYYNDWFADPDQTLDSLREAKIDNKVFLQIQPWNREGIVGTIDGGIGHAMHRYSRFNLHEAYIRPGRKPEKKNDTYIYGAVQGKFRKYLDWNARVDYHLAGFRSQDIRLDAQVKMSAYIKSRPITLTLSGTMDNRSPDYWMTTYSSNHFVWNKSFDKELITHLAVTLDVPSAGLEAGVWQNTTVDKLYYGYGEDHTIQPLQAAGTLSVTGAYLMKNFRIGILNLNHRVLFQKSSDEQVVSLPLVSGYASYFLDFMAVKDVLQMQIGVGGWYHTTYYAPGYNPALMQFHNQDFQSNAIEAPIKNGNYPYLEAFLTMKWKRMRVLAKFQNVGDDLIGRPNFFGAAHHPLNRRMFKLGFSWAFYD